MSMSSLVRCSAPVQILGSWKRLVKRTYSSYGEGMNVVSILSACIDRGRVIEVVIEVDIHPGLPVFSIIGLPDKGLEEAKERIRSAIRNSGYRFPPGRITVNLSPSFIHKKGTGFDLAICLALLMRSGQVPLYKDRPWVLGELALDGSVRAIQQLMPILTCASQRNTKVLLSASQKDYARLVSLCSCFVSTVKECKAPLSFQRTIEVKESLLHVQTYAYAFDKVHDQPLAKRAVAIALAGQHTMLLTGPPGVGKTMLVQAAHELLPPLTQAEMLTLANLYTYAGRMWDYKEKERPFVHPHYRVSARSLLGGGATLAPGEISLGYGGIVFLDEFIELTHEVREMLRQPLQEKEIRFSVPSHTVCYPVSNMIWAAHNSCPCGLLGVEGESCRCTPGQLAKYNRALSEPLLERFDIHVQLLKGKNGSKERGELSGKEVAERLRMVWEKGAAALWSREAESLLTRAITSLHLSQRVQRTVKQVAETITRFDGMDAVKVEAVQEALQYRHRRGGLAV
jgi:magnesium chelatase family protein